MLEHIIAGTDGSAHATHAVRWATELARRMGSELLLAHVVERDPIALAGGYAVLPDNELQQLRDAARAHLETDWSDAPRAAAVRWRPLLLDGNAAAALMRAAEAERADLLVIGNRGRGGFAELLLGSVGHQLVHQARIPVTIVPDR